MQPIGSVSLYSARQPVMRRRWAVKLMSELMWIWLRHKRAAPTPGLSRVGVVESPR